MILVLPLAGIVSFGFGAWALRNPSSSMDVVFAAVCLIGGVLMYGLHSVLDRQARILDKLNDQGPKG